MSGSGAYAGFVNYFERPIFASDCVTIEAPDKTVLPKFVYYAMKGKQDQVYLLQSGAGQPHVYARDISRFQIPLPPLKFQRELVSELDGYQRVIEGARQVVENWRPQVPANPEWPLVQLGEVCEFNPKKSKMRNIPSESEVAFVPMEDMNAREMNLRIKRVRPLGEVYKGYTYFADNDILLARVTPCFENGKSGIARDLPNGIGFGSSEFYVYRANPKKVLPEWIYYFIAERQFIETGQLHMTGTGGLQRLTKDFASSRLIPLPSLKVQREIVSRLESERKRVESCHELLESHTGKIRARVAEVWEEKTTHSDKASKPFAEAALLSVVAGRFGNEQYPLGRFRRTKFSYFVKRRSGEEVMEDFLKKAAGPYNPKARYKSESIALKKEYVRECKSEQRLGFVAGPNIVEAEKYLVERWRDALAWTAENFRYKKDEELETLATVDFAMLSLSGDGKALSPESVSAYMRADKEWRKKLKRPNFSPARIKTAMTKLRLLFDYGASPKGGDL